MIDQLSDESSKIAQNVEYTLESFGIKSKVMEVSFKSKHVLIELSIPYGVRVEEIEDLRKTLALTLASPTGQIEIIAPIPGKPLIGIKLPTKSN